MQSAHAEKSFSDEGAVTEYPGLGSVRLLRDEVQYLRRTSD